MPRVEDERKLCRHFREFTETNLPSSTLDPKRAYRVKEGDLIGGGMSRLGTLAILMLSFSVAWARDGAINKNCPVKGTPVNNGIQPSTYMGKTIGFC
jgi:hypothetical protein